MKVISIIGAGGHTRSSLNLLQKEFENSSFLIFDESYEKNRKEYINGINVAGKISDIDESSVIFLSIGDNEQRATYFNKLKNRILTKNLIHSSIIKEDYCSFGIANQIFANVYINSNVDIGDNNIINTSSILEHEVTIGNSNHISVGAKICGRVSIGNSCFIGAGAVVIDKISICDDVIIGAGSVVNKNITQPGTYVGVPAKKIK